MAQKTDKKSGDDQEKTTSAFEDDLKLAKTWAERYNSGSGDRKIMRNKWEKLTINQKALIIKLLIDHKTEMDDFLGQLCVESKNKSEELLLAKNQKANPVTIQEKVDRVANWESFTGIFTDWDLSKKSNFFSYLVGRIDYKNVGMHTILVRESKNKENYRNEIKACMKILCPEKQSSDEIKALLFTAMLRILVVPHKILIYFLGSVSFLVNKDIRWDRFYPIHRSSSLLQVSGAFQEKLKTNKSYTSFLTEYSNDYSGVLNKPLELIYTGKDYRYLIAHFLTEPKKKVGTIRVSDFFMAYNNLADEKMKYNKIRDVLSQWNTRIREKVFLYLQHGEGVEIKNNMKMLKDKFEYFDQ